jgi:hypothetical protein
LGVYGIEEVVNALNIPDKQDIIQSWYVRNQQVPPKQQVEQVEMIQDRLGQIVAQVMQEGPGGPGEEALAQMVMQNPALTELPDFQSLPGEIQERIITVAGLVGGQEDPGMDQPRA